VLQGVGGAVFPLAFGIIRDEFPRERVAGAIGGISTLLGVGGGLGIVLAGPIVDHLGYHWLFWIPLVMTALATVATFLFVPESPVKTAGTVNFGAAALLSGWLVALLLGVSMGSDWGWTSARVLGLFVVAAIVFVAWVAVELRARFPLVDVRLMRTPIVWWTNVSAFLFGFGMYSMMVVLPEFMETPRQADGCLENPTCLGRVAVALGVTRIVTGSVSERPKQYLFNLALHDIQTEKVLQRVFRVVDGSVPDLVRAVQDATDELFESKPIPGHVRVTSAVPAARVSVDEAYVGTTPLVSGSLLPGKHLVRVDKPGHLAWSSDVDVPLASTVEINLPADSLPERKSVPAIMAYGSGAGALLCLIAGTTFGILAQRESIAANRQEAQDDFEQRLRMGTAADALLASAAALSIGSALVFWLYRDHIFETDRTRR